MIGVLTEQSELEAVREFFELLKTPWEIARDGSSYDVLLTTVRDHRGISSAVTLSFLESNEAAARSDGPGMVRRGEDSIPIYSGLKTFSGTAFGGLVEKNNADPVAVSENTGDGRLVRIGYNLFSEVQHLLVNGQPAENAANASTTFNNA